MKRRIFLARSAAAGIAIAPQFPAPAIAQGRMHWRMVTAWPKHFPIVGTGSELLAKLITQGSAGRLQVTVHGAGELVPAFEAMDAVQSGTAEMGHGAPYYWKGKVAATQFLTSIPFGLTAQEQMAWFQYGGGQELADSAYALMGTKFLLGGNTGAQMGGWFNKEVHSIADLKGLKMRIPGLGAEVLRAAGVVVVNMPLGEILPALQSGGIDAAELANPIGDLAAGLYKTAKYYYYPGWQEPGSIQDVFVNLQAWSQLPSDLKVLIEAATATVSQRILSQFAAHNGPALRALVEDHGVELRRFADEILASLGQLSGEILNDLASQDHLSRTIFDSILRFRKATLNWSARSEQTYLEARRLPYSFAQPSKI